jgi:hypothetical protein
MKRLAIFLVITSLFIIGAGFYVEYVINRPCPVWALWTFGILLVLAAAAYGIYLVKQLEVLLNIKKPEQ